MTAYDDLLRALLVERFAPSPQTTNTATRLTELNQDPGSERSRARPTRRTPRRQTNPPNMLDTTRRTP